MKIRFVAVELGVGVMGVKDPGENVEVTGAERKHMSNRKQVI